MSNLTPIVIEQTASGERSFDIYSRLLRDRIVFLTGVVEESKIDRLVASILYLESENPEKPIHLYINSPGGIVTAGLSLYDVMQYVECPVYTYVTGQAASMGSLLASAGEAGHRYIMKHARTMIHQPLGGFSGQASDIEIHAKEILNLKRILIEIYLKHNSCAEMTFEKLEEMSDRDRFMSAEETVEFGFADEVITKR